MNESYKKTEIRRQKKKELIISKLKKNPVLQITCQNVGIGRSSYYRWREEDGKFAKKCDKAIAQGNSLINDMAESQLISAIRDKNLTAIIYWLKNHHRAYTTRIELDATHRIEEFKLTEEQQQLIDKAIKLMDLKKGRKND